MQKWVSWQAAALVVFVAVVCGNANAFIIERSNTEASSCAGGYTSTANCGYLSVGPTNLASHVRFIDIGVHVPSGSVGVTVCDQSWDGSTLSCAAPVWSSGSGEIVMTANGFSLIPNATLSDWDYYYTTVSCSTSGYFLKGLDYD